jgi:antitoxin (DNA-binding transcriptional repressor) of toxin-antitoxin stability system
MPDANGGDDYVRWRLAWLAWSRYAFGMGTISVSELKKRPANQWLKSAGKGDLVVTAKGKPVAVLLRIAAASVESTRALLCSVRALQAQAALQQAAAANGTADLSMSDIDAEIAAARGAFRVIYRT